jgi:ribonuclease HI
MQGVVNGFADRGRVIAATEAAYKKRVAAFGYVVSDGRWAIERYHYVDQGPDPTGPSAVLVAELRAVALLLERSTPLPAVLLMGNALAIRFLHAWQRGESDRMPAGYNLPERWVPGAPTPTLVRLSTLMVEHPGIWIEHVRAHKGRPLNEAADALASLALRGLPADETRSKAEELTQSFLAQWYHPDRH